MPIGRNTSAIIKGTVHENSVNSISHWLPGVQRNVLSRGFGAVILEPLQIDVLITIYGGKGCIGTSKQCLMHFQDISCKSRISGHN